MTEYQRSDMAPCCMCSARIGPDSFRDRPSYRDAYITGLCQGCQDLAYLSADLDEGRAYPIHDGAVVAVRAFRRRAAELVILPFRIVVPANGRARLVWEARHIVRAGPWQDRVDVRCELEPMSALLAGHQVCVHGYRNFLDPLVSARFDPLHLLIGLDDLALDAVARVCLVPEHIARATLDELPWRSAFGRALRPLETWWAPERGPLSTLRVCAVLASLLVEAGRDGRRPLDYLLADRRALFEDESDA